MFSRRARHSKLKFELEGKLGEASRGGLGGDLNHASNRSESHFDRANYVKQALHRNILILLKMTASFWPFRVHKSLPLVATLSL